MWLVVPGVLLFFFLALDSLIGDSPTMDEQNHLARGLAFARTGDPRLSLEHPPLVNTLSALPVLTLPDVRLPLDHPSWQFQPPETYWYAFADQLLWHANHDVTRMIFLARLPIVFLTLGLALAGYYLARMVWGGMTGLFAFGFLLFDPNILAHGRYTTTDVGGAAFLLLATILLWRLWAGQAGSVSYSVAHAVRLRREQTDSLFYSGEGWAWGRVLAAGVGLGLAFGSKLSTLSFVPIFGLLAVLPLYGGPWQLRVAGRLVQFLAAGVISLPVLWALYGFEWRAFRFRSDWLQALNGFSGPMPTFWAGIEQIVLLSGGGRPSFLLGQFSTEGFLAYFPVAFLVKTPLPVLLLFPVAVVLLLRNRRTRRRAFFLLLPAVLYFLLSMTSGLNIGYRHLLLMLPFVYVLIVGVAGGRGAGGQGGRGERAIPASSHVLLVIALAAVVLADLLIHPYYLSYFNVAAEGPENGYNILIDSNVDWGQDLLRLRDWMAEHEVERVKLAWFGTAMPAYYGIDYEPLPGLPYHFNLWWDLPFNPANPEPGVYAISASNLWELPLEEKYVFPYFRAREPDARVGYSILIYVVEESE